MNKEHILYEDNDIIVCYKPAGIATQTAKIGQHDMVSEVANYLAARKSVSGPNVFGRRPGAGVSGLTGGRQSDVCVHLVHRLDQPVEGILVFGKNQKAANGLSSQIVENRMQKYYVAVVSGEGLSAGAGQKEVSKTVLTDYLLKDNRSNVSRVVPPETKGAKKAVLEYEVLDKKELTLENLPKGLMGGAQEQSIALVKIKLITGRHHQIRVQMSHAGMSLLGDYKYAGERTKELSGALGQKQAALCAYRLEFAHPVTGVRMSFQRKPEGSIFQKFSI